MVRYGIRRIFQRTYSTLAHYVARDYTGAPFRLFSPSHKVALGIEVLLNLSFLPLRRVHNPRLWRAVRYSMASALLINEAAYHLWNWRTGQWTIQKMLPLHLCSVMVFQSALMLFTRSYRLYEMAYFFGIGGAIQALLTPDVVRYGFPHFRFFQSFISHGLIVAASVYMTVVEGYRPTVASVRRVLVTGNAAMVLVGGVNVTLGSNYMFLAHKPDIPTLLDKLGPWPIYLLWMELIGIGVVLVLYTPFAVYDWIRGKETP